VRPRGRLPGPRARGRGPRAVPSRGRAGAQFERLPDLWELVAQDRAGERILADLVTTANASLAERDEDARIHLLKNNVDSAGNAFGSHENYLVDRRGEFTRLPRILLPFLATRQIVTGAGGVVQEKDAQGRPTGEARFVFSRRSDHMWEAVSSATTRTRPIINTRDEPHGDPTRYRRLHVIVGDSTMSEVSTWLRFATTDLVLRLIENGSVDPRLGLEDTIAAIRTVARDLGGNRPLSLEGGGTASALEIQQRYLDLAATVATDGEHEAVETWQKALDAVRTGDRSWAGRTLDWAIKERLLLGTAERKGLGLGSVAIERLDLAYHDIDPRSGLFFALQRRDGAPSVLGEDRIEKARTVAPTTTRAHLRGRFVTAAQEAGVDHVADWTTLRIIQQGSLPVTLMDPFATESAEVDSLIGRLRPTGARPGEHEH
jgi:proteasome accessory factor A